MARVEHFRLKPNESMRISLHRGEVRSIDVTIDDPGIPLKVGESFTMRIVGVTREVTGR